MSGILMNTRIQVKPKIFMMQMEYYQNRINSLNSHSIYWSTLAKGDLTNPDSQYKMK